MLIFPNLINLFSLTVLISFFNTTLLYSKQTKNKFKTHKLNAEKKKFMYDIFEKKI